jgi:alpha-methylacyl-CoA racemase
VLGPLDGLKVVEFAGLGPGPFAAMLLADAGADVIRVDRPTGPVDGGALTRGRPWLGLDLKSADGVSTAIELVRQADVLVEGFRPGVMERLALGPDRCLLENPALVYGRMTGWGQEGPRAHQAGHDINYLNYLALTGALRSIARRVNVEVGPLGKVLAQQAVGVLVRPTLPRRVRVAEVDRDCQVGGDVGVPSHLGALVPGDRPKQRWRQIAHPCS